MKLRILSIFLICCLLGLVKGRPNLGDLRGNARSIPTDVVRPNLNSLNPSSLPISSTQGELASSSLSSSSSAAESASHSSSVSSVESDRVSPLLDSYGNRLVNPVISIEQPLDSISPVVDPAVSSVVSNVANSASQSASSASSSANSATVSQTDVINLNKPSIITPAAVINPSLGSQIGSQIGTTGVSSSTSQSSSASQASSASQSSSSSFVDSTVLTDQGIINTVGGFKTRPGKPGYAFTQSTAAYPAYQFIGQPILLAPAYIPPSYNGKNPIYPNYPYYPYSYPQSSYQPLYGSTGIGNKATTSESSSSSSASSSSSSSSSSVFGSIISHIPFVGYNPFSYIFGRPAASVANLANTASESSSQAASSSQSSSSSQSVQDIQQVSPGYSQGYPQNYPQGYPQGYPQYPGYIMPYPYYDSKSPVSNSRYPQIPAGSPVPVTQPLNDPYSKYPYISSPSTYSLMPQATQAAQSKSQSAAASTGSSGSNQLLYSNTDLFHNGLTGRDNSPVDPFMNVQPQLMSIPQYAILAQPAAFYGTRNNVRLDN